jgi:hypothetical protein
MDAIKMSIKEVNESNNYIERCRTDINKDGWKEEVADAAAWGRGGTWRWRWRRITLDYPMPSLGVVSLQANTEMQTILAWSR